MLVRDSLDAFFTTLFNPSSCTNLIKDSSSLFRPYISEVNTDARGMFLVGLSITLRMSMTSLTSSLPKNPDFSSEYTGILCCFKISE